MRRALFSSAIAWLGLTASLACPPLARAFEGEWRALSADEPSPLVLLSEQGAILRTGAEAVRARFDQPYCQDAALASAPSFGHCSGILLEDNYVLTASHCVTDCSQLIAYARWREGDDAPSEPSPCARVVARDSRLDLVLFALERPLSITPARVGELDDARFDFVSHPLGVPARVDEDAALLETYDLGFAARAAALPGSSGGGAFNHAGELVGIAARSQGNTLTRAEGEACARFERATEEEEPRTYFVAPEAILERACRERGELCAPGCSAGALPGRGSWLWALLWLGLWWLQRKRRYLIVSSGGASKGST